MLKYENRYQLYKFLIDDFGFIKVDEKYEPEHFGNFYILLSGKEFLIQYINDRSFLTIEIASKTEPSNWYALSFIKDFLYNPDNINDNEQDLDKVKRVKNLNNFLRNDFHRVAELLNERNFPRTKQQLDERLKQQFTRRFG